MSESSREAIPARRRRSSASKGFAPPFQQRRAQFVQQEQQQQRSLSPSSLDSNALLDHRSQPESIPRPSFLRNRSDRTGGEREERRGKGRRESRDRHHEQTPLLEGEGEGGAGPSSGEQADQHPFVHYQPNYGSGAHGDAVITIEGAGDGSSTDDFTNDPTSDEASNNSEALDDVCFPQDVGDEGERKWPDIAVLEEWAEEEKKESGDGGGVGNAEWLRSRQTSEPERINGRLRGVHQTKEESDRPYRFTYFSDSLPATIHSQNISGLVQSDLSFTDLFSPKADLAPTFWLDCLTPTDSEMKVLARAFGIHPLTAEDITMGETREKVELFRNYYLVSFRSFEQDPKAEEYLEGLDFYIIVFRQGVISFHHSLTPHPANVRRRIRQLKDYITVTSDWISYALIDDITDAFQPLIYSIETEVDDIDDSILSFHSDNSVADDSEMLRRIGECRKKVMGLLRLLGSKADVIKGFSKRCNEHWDIAPRSEIGLYLGDIQDHIVTMVQNLGHYEKMMSRSHSNYLAQINIQMTRVNNKMNDVLSRLTVLGTIVLPMNIITGLWGMNVKVPGQEIDNLNWYFGITVGLVMFGVMSYLFFMKVYKVLQ